MEKVQNKVANATKWASITEIAAKMVAPITNMILARLLVPGSFGAVATINVVISFADIFADAGFQKYLIQHEFRDEESLNKSTNVAFWTNIIISAVLWLIIVIFRDPIASLAGNPDLGMGVAVASFAMFMTSFSSIQMSRFKREFSFKKLFYVRMITTFIPLIITIPLAFFLKSYWALVIGTLCTQLTQAVMLTAFSKWKPKLKFSIEELKKMFGFSIWTLLETIAIWSTANIGTFIVGNALSEHYLGLYKTSMTTVNSYMAVITAATTPVMFSALSRLQNDEEQFRKVFFKFQRFVALLVFPMGAGLFLYSDLATLILLGSEWMEASGFVGLWALMSSVTIIFSNYNSEVYRSKGKPKISLLAQILHLSALVPALLLSAESGFKALYISRSLIRFQGIAVGLFIMWFLFKFKPWEIFKNVMPSMLATLGMSGCALLLRYLSSGLVWEIISVVICMIVYFLLILLMPKQRRELLKIKQVKMLLNKTIFRRRKI